MPNALLVYPEHAPTYWGLEYAVRPAHFKALCPPLGLLTVAALFPPKYSLRVVDMNVDPLEDADLEWADLVFTSTILTQRNTHGVVVRRCNEAGVPVIAGGAFPTSYHDEIVGVDHFLLGEVENIFAGFLEDLENGTAKPIYRETGKPDVSRTPIPRYDLINLNAYSVMTVQFSRGCPFDCEFCDITKLYGRVPRTKSPEQVVAELDTLYRLGCKNKVFLVDDNFIGNKRDALNLLPSITQWQRQRGYPFELLTEASLNLARLDKLLDAMVDAGFSSVFIGIETPTPAALIKMKKPQNVDDGEDEFLFNAVRKIQGKGIEVFAGFILGLDEDDETVFDSQIEFIQKAGIPTAIVGLLQAVRNTNLYHRLKAEDRLLDMKLGEELDLLKVNYKPEMDAQTLYDGFRRVLITLYDPPLRNYFDRCRTMIENVKYVPHLRKPVSPTALGLALSALRRQLEPAQLPAFNELIADVTRKQPGMLPLAIQLAGMGYHYNRFTTKVLATHDFKESLSAEVAGLQKASAGRTQEDVKERAEKLMAEVQARYREIPVDFRYFGDGVDEAMEEFRSAVRDGSGEPRQSVVVQTEVPSEFQLNVGAPT